MGACIHSRRLFLLAFFFFFLQVRFLVVPEQFDDVQAREVFWSMRVSWEPLALVVKKVRRSTAVTTDWWCVTLKSFIPPEHRVPFCAIALKSVFRTIRTHAPVQDMRLAEKMFTCPYSRHHEEKENKDVDAMKQAFERAGYR